jgi:hypothetical protein
MQRVTRFVGFVLLAAAPLAALAQPVHDPAAWLADLDRIETGMAQHYANLDWVRDERHLDLAALDRTTRARLRSSRTTAEAQMAMRDFVAAFRDPHLEFGRRDRDAPAGGGTAPPPVADCGAAGYRNEQARFAPALARLPGWRMLDSGEFPTATAGATGLLRIGSFREQDYGDACRRAFRAGMSERALQLAVRADLQRALRAAIDRLKAARVRRLIVDVTGNGGGSEWNREAAALFTNRTMRRAEPRVAAPACDRRGIWTGARPCPVFSGRPATVTLAGAGAWTGPLWVLIDHRSASAAEEFAGWLRDNGVARLVGETSFGAGCGYMNGGAPVALAVAPVVLKMPNCARFTAAGRNEIEGWTPDIVLPAARNDADGWADGLGAALAREVRP